MVAFDTSHASRLGRRGLGERFEPFAMGPNLEPFVANEDADAYHEQAKKGYRLSSHGLKDFRNSPMDYRAKRLGIIKDKDSAAYRFGRAFHVLTGEGPAAYQLRYTYGGPVNPRTGKCFKDVSKKFKAWAATQPLEALTTDQHKQLCAMALNVRANPAAETMFSFGWPELVFRADYCGRPCQIRTDWLNPFYGFSDLKTCQKFDLFEVDAISFDYLGQLAFYRAMLRIATGKTLPAYLIPSEKERPYRADVIEVDADRLATAEEINEEAIATLAKCEANDYWPSTYDQARNQGGSHGVSRYGSRVLGSEGRRASPPACPAEETRERSSAERTEDELGQASEALRRAVQPSPASSVAPASVVPPSLTEARGNRMPRAITSGRIVTARKTLIYGTEGVGKSSWACSAPNSVVIPTEEGTNDIDVFRRFDLCETYEHVLESLFDLYSDPKYYTDARNGVIDSADWLERLMKTHLCQKHNVANITAVGGGFGKHVDFIVAEWSHILSQLDKIRRERNISITLVAHADHKKFSDPESDSYDQFQPRLMKETSFIIREWCDEVLFARWKTYTRVEEGGFNKTTTKAVGTGERILRTVERPSAVAKNRLPGIPPELPLDYKAFAEYLPGGPKAAKFDTPTAAAA